VRRRLLGAHVSTAGGVQLAPARGAAIGANVIQIFTKNINRWAERDFDEATTEAFRSALADHGIVCAGSHDSYLINLASPDRMLRERSFASFRRELVRCQTLQLDFLVTHPGNATDGDRRAALRRNADSIRRALEEVPGRTRVLIEGTAGQGSALGRSFEELAELLELLAPAQPDRVGVCLDTAHLLAAGYDIAGDYDGVIRRLDGIIGLAHVHLFHLNDSKMPLGSRVDRHEHLGEGHIGRRTFRRIVHDERFAGVPKLIETPKGNDPLLNDRRNLGWLLRCRSIR
jgi:deoxyribonuclease-4